jgi:hypothetical protein
MDERKAEAGSAASYGDAKAVERTTLLERFPASHCIFITNHHGRTLSKEFSLYTQAKTLDPGLSLWSHDAV